MPVFFIISGYLQFAKPRNYKDTVLKKLKGLMLPMLIWTAVACLEYLALKKWTGRILQFAFLESSNPLDWLLHKIPWIYMTLCLLALVFVISPLTAPHALFFYSLGGRCTSQ